MLLTPTQTADHHMPSRQNERGSQQVHWTPCFGAGMHILVGVLTHQVRRDRRSKACRPCASNRTAVRIWNLEVVCTCGGAGEGHCFLGAATPAAGQKCVCVCCAIVHSKGRTCLIACSSGAPCMSAGGAARPLWRTAPSRKSICLGTGCICATVRSGRTPRTWPHAAAGSATARSSAACPRQKR